MFRNILPNSSIFLNVILELCKGVHCVDLGESFPTHIYLQNLASIQPRTSPPKFGRSQRSGASQPAFTGGASPASVSELSKSSFSHRSAAETGLKIRSADAVEVQSNYKVAFFHVTLTSGARSDFNFDKI